MRKDERRSPEPSRSLYSGPERRYGERRGAIVLAAAITALVATSGEAQIYTRRNANGVVEATNVPAPGYRLTYAGKGTLIHSRGYRRIPYNGRYDGDIRDAASTYGVAPDLVRAVIAVESEFDALAVSSKGAQGLMQLMPFTARRFGVMNAFDARQNIFGGVQYLRILLDLFGGNVSLALAGYNAGENAVLRYKGIPPYKETQGYVRKIEALMGSGTASFYVPVRRAAEPSPVIGYAPSAAGVLRASAPVGGGKRPSRPPVKPRTYYKYRDEKGVLHVAHTAPPEGVLYTMIRAFD
jgi:soluble lytic murein transglycosylase-like protein